MLGAGNRCLSRLKQGDENSGSFSALQRQKEKVLDNLDGFDKPDRDGINKLTTLHTPSTLRKFLITYYLTSGKTITQTTEGLTVEAIEASVQQKLSQKELIIIYDGITAEHKSQRNNTSANKAAFTRIDSDRVVRYEIEEMIHS